MQNVKRRILSILMTLALVLTLTPALCAEAQAASVGSMPIGISGIEAGDTVYFGTADGDALVWRVLDTETNAGENGLFLLSEALFEGSVFDKTAPYSNAWYGSETQSWCVDFAAEAFSAGELQAITETDKAAGTSESYDIAWSDAALDGDKVFFLSAAELAEFVSAANDDSKLIAKLDGEAGSWWLRSARKDGTLDAGVVTAEGKVVYGQAYLNWAARPAMNLWGGNVVFASPAVGGKADAVDSTLSTIDTEKPDGWKLTVADANLPAVTAAPNGGGSGFTVTVDGGKVKLDYSGAPVGANEYVSVLLVNEDVEISHYGRIANNSASGTAEIDIPALTAGNYYLVVFNEQCNGDYATDYVGDSVSIPLTVILNPQDAPQAAFTANGDSAGVLSGLQTGTKYSTDGGATWNTADGATAQLTGVSAANDIKLYIPGDGTSTDDSEEQVIDVTQPAAPSVTKTDCTDYDNNDGTIAGVDSTMEYKKTGDAGWTPVTGTSITDLEPGTYLVRVKATGTALASNGKSVVIDAHQCDMGNDWQKDKTHHWMECDCGHEERRGEHQFGDWEVTKEAEGKKDGEKQRVCEVCQYVDTDVIPAPAPETGDSNMMWLLAVLVSGIALAGALIYGRKSKLLTKIFSVVLAAVMVFSLVLPYAETAAAAAGDSSYIGYDGYIWSGKDRTDKQQVDLSAPNVPENTIGLYENAYFALRELNLAREQV
ncbi:MAG: LPXTG cell wall anchor domain-containing protein, partial [Oscillospiraceae bacterium]|nr:LPXTG cell wall anchor domain-containing protein [Oscillospiraceae bacterium]